MGEAKVADVITIQDLVDGRLDVKGMATFYNGAAGLKVPRRLADDIETLEFYLEYMRGLQAVYEQPSGIVEVNGVQVKPVKVALKEALDAAVVGGGGLADTAVALTALLPNQVPRTLAAQNAEVVNIANWGALPAPFDSTTAIKNAAAYAKTLPICSFYVPAHTYAVTDTIEIDLANKSSINFDGAIKSTAMGKELLIIGSKTTNRFNYNLKDIAAYHADRDGNITTDTLKKSVAVKLLNLVSCVGNVRTASGCWDGVQMDATMPNGGSSYNIITLGSLKDNVRPLVLKAQEPNGYTNENTFIGGSLGHSGSFPYTGEEVDIFIDVGTIAQKLNNNLFFRPSLESNSATTKAAIINGNYNSVYMPRVENSQNYQGFTIEFTSASSNCSVLGGGFGLNNSTILDNGGSSKYENNSTKFFAGAPLGDRGVLELQNTAANTGKVLSSKNTAKTETFSIFANGDITSATTGYFQTGIRWQTQDGTKTDRGLYISSATSDIATVAKIGSLHLSTTDGSLSIKKSNATNASWSKLQEIFAGRTLDRPATPKSGYSMFDTTLNKPIWYNGTAWVDAVGATV